MTTKVKIPLEISEKLTKLSDSKYKNGIKKAGLCEQISNAFGLICPVNPRRKRLSRYISGHNLITI